MSIEENRSKVGWGSWFCTQNYKDYCDKISLEQWQRHIYQQCVNRIEALDLTIGSKIELVYIGGRKPRKYTGILTFVNSHIYIKQESREVSFDCCLVDDIKEILEYGHKINKSIVYHFNR